MVVSNTSPSHEATEYYISTLPVECYMHNVEIRYSVLKDKTIAIPTPPWLIFSYLQTEAMCQKNGFDEYIVCESDLFGSKC